MNIDVAAILATARRIRSQHPEIDRYLRTLDVEPQHTLAIAIAIRRYLIAHGIDPSRPDQFLPWIPREIAGKPGIVIGTVIPTGDPLTIALDELTLNLVVVGPPGTGKTTLMSHFVRGLQQLDPPVAVIAFDQRGDWEEIVRGA